MEHDRLLRLLRVAAALALAAGLLLTVRTLGTLPRVRERYEKRSADLKAIAALAATGRQQAAAVQAWSQAGGPAPALADVFRRQIPDLTLGVHDMEAVPGLPGWQVRRTAVTLANADFRRLEDVVRVAGALRPPWSLAECVLQASDRPGIAARIELVFETVDRVE
jgi:hypothetical protein